ncbi:MAG: polysaccharide deacetylase family protein, partial [Thermomicrobiales bacterium]|nr:polysaccharide deacetylase family protein [Thermomicrobiales bacterium]
MTTIHATPARQRPTIRSFALRILLTLAIVIPMLGTGQPGMAKQEGDPSTPVAEEPTATATIEPTATETALPTDTPEPTATLAPTETPTPTATRPPTFTPTSSATATVTATASPTTTPTTVVRPAAVNPTCALGHTVGVAAQRVRITCQGFAAGARVNLYWQDLGKVTSFSVLSTGAGTTTFLIPAAGAGLWRVRASDGLGVSAWMTFTVRPPALALSPAQAPNGASVAMTLSGFRAREQVTIRWYALTGASFSTLGSATMSAKGGAAVTLIVPKGAGKGGHRVEVAGRTSGLIAWSTLTVTKPGEVRYLDQGAAGCKRIAFIFDVGIGNTFDTGILDTLAANDVPATMFLMGWWADRYPALARRLATEGYVIGSHGYAAQELTSRSDAAVSSDIRRATTAIAKATGAPPERWFTPYAAAIDDRVKALIAKEGYVPVGWRVPANDYAATATEEDVYRRVVNGAYDGAIVEFHIDGPATKTSTGRALPRIIKTLHDRGYQFVTIPEMALRCPSASAISADVVFHTSHYSLSTRTLVARSIRQSTSRLLFRAGTGSSSSRTHHQGGIRS